MALTKKTPATIKGDLTIKAQGEQHNLLLTYKNYSQDVYDQFAKNEDNFKRPDALPDDIPDFRYANAQLVLFLVQSFDDGTDKDFPLTVDGLIELDSYWPGALIGIVQGYHQARAASVEGNSKRR